MRAARRIGLGFVSRSRLPRHGVPLPAASERFAASAAPARDAGGAPRAELQGARLQPSKLNAEAVRQRDPLREAAPGGEGRARRNARRMRSST